jgi:hypothetical protein
MALPPTRAARQRAEETPPAGELMLERHFTIAQLAELWAVSHDYVTDLFLDEPGIIRSPRGRSGTIRIAASVVERVYKRMMEAAAVRQPGTFVASRVHANIALTSQRNTTK